MPDAEISSVYFGVESEVKGTDKIKELAKTVKEASDGVDILSQRFSDASKTGKDAEKAIDGVSKVASTMNKVGSIMDASKASLLKSVADSQRSQIAKILETGDYDQGSVARKVLSLRNTESRYARENALENPKMTAEEAGKIAEETTKLQLLEKQAEAARQKLAELFNTRADDGTIAKAEAAYQSLLNKIEQTKQAGEGQEDVADKTEKIGNAALRSSGAVQTFLDKLFTVKGVLSGVKGAVNGFASALKNLTNHGHKTNTFLSRFLESVKRIMFYRAIRTVIKDIGQAFKEGVNNVYQWSKALSGDFAQTMDSLATSILYLKNALGAMVSPLISALAPAIEYIIDRFVALINVINQFIAAITGSGTWTKAIKYPTEYAKAAGKAAQKAKQFGLAAIDQLTILSKASTGAGGAGAVDYSKMFETVELKGGIWDKIKDLIDKGDWRGLGKLLAQKFNELVANWDAEAWGKKLGTAINNGIEFAYGFLKETDFTKLGSKIAEFLNGALGAINTETLGRTIVRVFTGAFDFFLGFIETLDWELVGTKIHDFIIGAISEFTEWSSTLDWGKLGENIYSDLDKTLTGLNFNEVLTAMLHALGSTFTDVCGTVTSFFASGDWETFGESIYDTMKTVLTELPFEEMFKSFFEAVGTAFGAVVLTVDGFFKAGWDDLKKYFDEKMNDTGENVVQAFIDGILSGIDLIGGFQKWINENIGEPFEKGVKKAFGIEGEGKSKILDTIGERVSQGFINGILGALPWFLRNEWVRETFFKPLVDKIKELFGIHSPSTVMEDIGKNLVQGLINGFTSTWSSFTQAIEGKWNELSNWWGNLKFPEFKIPRPHFTVTGSFGWNGSGFDFPDIDVDWYARGGHPDAGELFIANEAGAEMVGSMNGRTTVSNNEDIVEGIRRGVYDAVSSAMARGTFNANVYLDGKQISGAVVKNVNSETRRTGRSPLLSY